MEFVSYHPQIKLEILNGSSSPIHLREAKEVCLEAFGHWGSVPKADASAPYSSPHNLLPTAYVAVHRDFGIVGFACIKVRGREEREGLKGTQGGSKRCDGGSAPENSLAGDQLPLYRTHHCFASNHNT